MVIMACLYVLLQPEGVLDFDSVLIIIVYQWI